MTITAELKGIVGLETEAFGSDPSQIDKVYQFRYRVVGLDDVIPSHNDNLTPNPSYPSELQPRLRDSGIQLVLPWISGPGRADISGVDTPAITRRSPRLSGGRGPRITPKRPRLSR